MKWRGGIFNCGDLVDLAAAAVQIILIVDTEVDLVNLAMAAAVQVIFDLIFNCGHRGILDLVNLAAAEVKVISN